MNNSTKKRYWKGVEEYKNDINFVKNAQNEFNLDDIEGGTARRDFLKMLGFGVAAVSLAACDAPVKKTIPYLNKPEDVEPGIPNYYATSYVENGDYSSIIVKTREGRPIKVEGNPQSKFTLGGTSARAQASVLSLYDNGRLSGPTKGGKAIAWEDLDKEVAGALKSSSSVRVVSSSVLSPSTKALIAEMGSNFSSFKHVQYDANSASAISEAHAENFGLSGIPFYDFSKAEVIVGVNCDFLGTWIAPTTFSAQWAKGRKLSSAEGGKKEMSRHFQFETGLTITGAAADYRDMIKPSEEGVLLANLYNSVVSKLGNDTVGVEKLESSILDKCASNLVAARGKALVVSGSKDKNVQIIVNALNQVLSSYGNTINLSATINTRQGNDADMNAFIADLKGGKVDAVFFLDANPVFDHVKGGEIKDAIGKAKLSVAFSQRADETASACKYVATTPHFLESWGDANPATGHYSLMQPTITHVFNSRQAQDSMLTWTGSSTSYHDYLKSYWKNNILAGTSWVKALHEGVYVTGESRSLEGISPSFNLNAAVAAVSSKAKKASGLELDIFESVALGNGAQANNPWLQELPDPISKVTWENTLALSQKTANELGVDQGDFAKVSVGGMDVELPVLIQPGQAHGTASIAMGYGRTAAGKAGNVGSYVIPMTGMTGATVEKTKSGYTLAQTQTHETVMGRQAVVQESVLSEYVKNPKAGRFEPHVETYEGTKKPYAVSLWNGHEKKNHSWGMVIDLNTCTGCSACLVACQAENNVPVVGKKEVVRAREMHWIRLDRYYSTDADTTYKIDPGHLREMEVAAENPEVVIQPMMCQHCSNAPCETVCPVLATTHSSEGLNQMTYNRCVGTRYCANNCPYKVRRFNWFKYHENDEFDYHMNSELGRMVLNPDVTVRSRGVIEKCSMCVQRIQAGKLTAKRERRRPVDGEINTACAQSCPTGAIVFGDMMDPESEVSKTLAVEKEGRAFHVLEELNVQPQISYLTKIRNKDEVKVATEAPAHSEDHQS